MVAEKLRVSPKLTTHHANMVEGWTAWISNEDDKLGRFPSLSPQKYIGQNKDTDLFYHVTKTHFVGCMKIINRTFDVLVVLMTPDYRVQI